MLLGFDDVLCDRDDDDEDRRAEDDREDTARSLPRCHPAVEERPNDRRKKACECFR